MQLLQPGEIAGAEALQILEVQLLHRERREVHRVAQRQLREEQELLRGVVQHLHSRRYVVVPNGEVSGRYAGMHDPGLKEELSHFAALVIEPAALPEPEPYEL